jgi:2,3-bisphosphoglycerate-independent phosphoglycerate mutase
MKLAVVILAGAGDRPAGEGEERTPLESVRLPTLDALAKEGRVGSVKTIPDGLTPSHEHALVSLFGVDPEQFPVGAGALLASALGQEMKEGETAFRCDLVNLYGEAVVDPGAGSIGGQEAAILVSALSAALDSEVVKLLPGRRWRNLLLVGGDQAEGVRTTAPSAFLGESVKTHRPRGAGAEVLERLMERAGAVLAEHEINAVRVDLGENPANGIWIWGGGRPVTVPWPFEGKTVAVGRHPSFTGLARAAGIAVRDLDEDAGLKVVKEKTLAALRTSDLVLVHLDGGLAASRQGDRAGKARFLADADQQVLAPLRKRLVESLSGRLLVVASHVSACDVRRDLAGMVPFVLAGSGTARYGEAVFSEAGVSDAELKVEHGHELLEYALRD